MRKASDGKKAKGNVQEICKQSPHLFTYGKKEEKPIKDRDKENAKRDRSHSMSFREREVWVRRLRRKGKVNLPLYPKNLPKISEHNQCARP